MIVACDAMLTADTISIMKPREAGTYVSMLNGTDPWARLRIHKVTFLSGGHIA